MKKDGLRFMNLKVKLTKHHVLSCLLVLLSWISSAQMTSSIDSTSIKIGEQITYQILVEADTTDLVVFPEGQTFLPLEMIRSYATDSLASNAMYKLIKRYGLTQFDSGAYTIPPQKIVIGTKTFFTDSLKVEVNDVLIDTTKQKLYDIKPLIDVDKSLGNWWKYLIYFWLLLVLIAALLYWFVWRAKPMTQEEKIALLSPYERAKLSLKELDEADYLAKDQIKDYYSELTGIIRTYLDEKVYDHSLESTTEELINRLQLLKDGNKIQLSPEDINNIETILKRADLVKFAKSKPDIALAEIDRKTIDLEIDQVKEALPEPTEEEKLRDQKYREEQERKKKRRKIILTSVVAALVIIGSFIGVSAYYGFSEVRDTILGHPSKKLLEGEWVTSEYGAPGITISTPKVLQRQDSNVPKDLEDQLRTAKFAYGSLLEGFNIAVSSTVYTKEDIEIDIEKQVDGYLKIMEAEGAQNLIVQNDKFVTPNGAEGLKTYGSAEIPVSGLTDKYAVGNYILLNFTAKNVLQQVMITWRDGDTYAKEMTDRIMASIELKKDEKKKKEES